MSEEPTLIYVPTTARGRQVGRHLLTDEDATAVAALPADSAFLIAPHTAGTDANRYLLDTDHITVGRHPDNAIWLDDVTVSRRHLELLHEDHDFFLHDLASLNGTYLNGQRVELAALRDGDEIRIGKFRLFYYGSPQHGRHQRS